MSETNTTDAGSQQSSGADVDAVVTIAKIKEDVLRRSIDQAEIEAGRAKDEAAAELSSMKIG